MYNRVNASRSASRSSLVTSRCTYGAVTAANAASEKTVLPVTVICRTKTRSPDNRAGSSGADGGSAGNTGRGRTGGTRSSGKDGSPSPGRLGGSTPRRSWAQACIVPQAMTLRLAQSRKTLGVHQRAHGRRRGGAAVLPCWPGLQEEHQRYHLLRIPSPGSSHRGRSSPAALVGRESMQTGPSTRLERSLPCGRGSSRPPQAVTAPQSLYIPRRHLIGTPPPPAHPRRHHNSLVFLKKAGREIFLAGRPGGRRPTQGMS